MMQARILLITSKKLTKFGVKKIHQTRIEGFWHSACCDIQHFMS